MLGLALACVLGAWARPSVAGEPDGPAYLYIVGPPDTVLLGQAGYCGEMQPYDRTTRVGVPLPAGRKTWARLRNPRCRGDLSFTPEPGRTYLLRVAGCGVDLHVVNPGHDPSPAPMVIEPARSCLLPWNHGGAGEPPASAASSP